MPAICSSLYQSGQHVLTSGTYEIAGTQHVEVTNRLEAGQVFPFHEGWEVGWHLRSDDAVQNPNPAVQEPSDSTRSVG